MDKLTHSISDGFSLLQGLLYSPPGGYQQPYGGYNPQQSGIIFNPGQFSDYRHSSVATPDHITTEGSLSQSPETFGKS